VLFAGATREISSDKVAKNCKIQYSRNYAFQECISKFKENAHFLETEFVEVHKHWFVIERTKATKEDKLVGRVG